MKNYNEENNMKKENVISNLRIVENTHSDEYKWVGICNRWLSGGGVSEEEIVYLATMNMVDFCHEFKEIVTRVVYDFCEQYAEVWSDHGNPCCSWGFRLPNGAILRTGYGGIAGSYWNNADHYSIAE